MSYLCTGEKGTPLKEIISNYGNKDYEVIQCRTKWIDYEGNQCDELFGYCQYINGELIPLDGDCYSLDDLYISWAEAKHDNEDWLIVWEDGYLSDEKNF